MGDLLGEGDALAAKDTLYRCLDLLLEHKRALFDQTGCYLTFSPHHLRSCSSSSILPPSSSDLPVQLSLVETPG